MSHKIAASKFAMVGILNTAIDFSVFVILIRHWSLELAVVNLIAYMVAVTNSYVLNRLWTFKAVTHGQGIFLSYVRFVAVNSVGLGMGTVVVYALRPYMIIEAAKVFSIVASMLWNYLGTRYFVFNRK